MVTCTVTWLSVASERTAEADLDTRRPCQWACLSRHNSQSACGESAWRALRAAHGWWVGSRSVHKAMMALFGCGGQRHKRLL